MINKIAKAIKDHEKNLQVFEYYFPYQDVMDIQREEFVEKSMAIALFDSRLDFEQLFDYMDADHSGVMSYNEFSLKFGEIMKRKRKK